MKFEVKNTLALILTIFIFYCQLASTSNDIVKLIAIIKNEVEESGVGVAVAIEFVQMYLPENIVLQTINYKPITFESLVNHSSSVPRMPAIITLKKHGARVALRFRFMNLRIPKD